MRGNGPSLTFSRNAIRGLAALAAMRRKRKVPSAPGRAAAAPLKVAHRLQAWGAALGFGAFGLLPIDWASATGGFLARTIGPALGITKRARINLRRAIPALSDAEITRIIRLMWENLGRVAAEYPHLRKIRVFDPAGPVETHGSEHIDRAIAADRRMII